MLFGEVMIMAKIGDTKIISVCRVTKANDGGVGGCKSISRGTESQVFWFNDKPSARGSNSGLSDECEVGEM